MSAALGKRLVQTRHRFFIDWRRIFDRLSDKMPVRRQT